MKLFGRKGKSVRIEIILAIIVLLMILCMGFGYCLHFTRVEGYEGYHPKLIDDPELTTDFCIR